MDSEPTPRISTDPASANGDGTTSPQSSRGRSFSFLRRSKSNEAEPQRSASASRKLTRRRTEAERKRREAEAAANTVPRMPSYHMLPSISNPYLVDSSLQLQSSSQQAPMQSSAAQPASPKRWGYNPNAFYQKRQTPMDRSANPVPPPGIPEASPPGTASGQPSFDPYARTESMTNRGRMSYASSFVSSQGGTAGATARRVRRRKDPTPFNVLIVGAKNCGKTSFIEFLRSSLSRPARRFATQPISPPGTASTEQHGSFTSHYLKTELDGERVGLTLYDSRGLERHLVDLQLREMAAFVESKFQETFNEEQKVRRATGVTDTHIHCVLLILDPARLDTNISMASPNATRAPNNSAAFSSRPRIIGGLDEDLDIDVLRTLQGKTTVIPVISKADTITTAHMSYLKRTVYESLKKIKFDPLAALRLEGNDDEAPNEADEDAYINQGSDKDSSIFHDADDGEETVNGSDGGDATRTTIPPKAAADLSKPPQHDEIRVSHLSENMELPYLPMSILSPDIYDPGTIGRRFPWGFADPYNAEHCDFSRLKESVFSEWRSELRETSRDRWYEGWRTNQMRRRGPGSLSNAKNSMVAGPRAVSSAATYGTASSSVNGYPNQQRSVSNNEIGVAVGQADQTAYRQKPMNGHTLPTR